ncbi:MAG TPA: class I SAM-dependent methyltransferase [Natronosporangium sp.]
MAKLAVSIGAAAAVAVALLLLPQEFRLPLAAAAAAGAAVLYALRERAALRNLLTAVRYQHELEWAHRKLLTSIRRRVKEGAAGVQELSSQTAGVRPEIQRVHQLGTEIAATHAAATAELRAQLDRQRAEFDRRLGQLHDLVDRISDRTEQLAKQLESATTQGELRQLHRDAVASRREFQQTEALLNLHAAFQVRAPLPPSRNWAASPDLLLYLTTLVLERRPRLVVELGSGLSTVWLSYAMERAGTGGKVISLEHEPAFAARTEQLVAAHGLDAVSELRCAPLTDVELAGETWPWYHPDLLADIVDCELLFVDGPPGATRDRARYPALPLLAGKLADHAAVILDDCVRSDEQAILAEWTRQFPEWRVELLGHEKGTAVLTRPAGD